MTRRIAVWAMIAIGGALALRARAAPPATAPATTAPAGKSTAVGTWVGSIREVGRQIDVRLRLVSGLGRWGGSADLPQMEVTFAPVDVIEIAGRTVKFALRGVPGSPTFNGFLADDGQSISGTFTWGSGTTQFRLERETKADRPRPQDPAPPLPYDVTEVAFENAEAHVRLAGELTVPRGAAGQAFPAVVIVPPSGYADRDGRNAWRHRPTLVLADQLTRAGFVVLRYDKRGAGLSGGDFEKATLAEFAADAAAALRYAKGLPVAVGGKLAVIGHGEGAQAAAWAAGRETVSAVVLIGAMGTRGQQAIVEQTRWLTAAAGVPEGAVEARVAGVTALTTALAAGNQAEVDRLIREQLRIPAGATQDEIQSQVASRASGWRRPAMLYTLRYDPLPKLRAITAPTLLLWGQNDAAFPPAVHREAVAAALAAGNAPVTVRILPGLNHFLQPADDGAQSRYATTEQTLSPAAVTEIVEFLRANNGVK